MLRDNKISQVVIRLLAAGLLCVLLMGRTVEAQTCSHPDEPVFYHGYTVRQVRVESPIDFLHAVKSRLNELKPDLPLQPGGTFTPSLYTGGVELIRERLRDTGEEEYRLFRLVVVIGDFGACDESEARQLDVIYRVFTTDYNPYLSHAFEIKREEIERPAATGATSNATGKFMIRPYAGYNRTRRGFGGAKVLMRTPGGIFDSVRFVASGSSSSNAEELELIGSRTLENSLINHLEYSLGYRHSEVPSGDIRLREGKMQAQLFAASRPLGARKIVMRYGLSLEGGNQQSDLDSIPEEEKSLANSGYGSLKTYIGATMRSSAFSWTASYGLQAGTRGASSAIDFVKHIADFSLAIRLLPVEKKDGKCDRQFNQSPGAEAPSTPRSCYRRLSTAQFNKPFDIEAQFTAGKIQRLGRVPIFERFFGGNEAQEFIAGDNWKIRGGPYIRSLPQNRLNAASTVGPIGGTSFYSFNLTLARPVWGYPIIPAELKQDPEFPKVLKSQQESAHKSLTLYHTVKLPAFMKLSENLGLLIADLNNLDSMINSLAPKIQGDLAEQLETAKESTGFLLLSLNGILEKLKSVTPQGEKDGFSVEGLFILLNKGIPDEIAENVNPLINSLANTELKNEASKLEGARDAALTRQDALMRQSKAIDTTEAKKQADDDLSAVEPILKALLRELNLVSISPVLVFDAARIWPDKGGTRFGIGGGVRFTLVNFNVTAGYAFNPDPRPGEGRGAMFFSMDVTNLFR